MEDGAVSGIPRRRLLQLGLAGVAALGAAGCGSEPSTGSLAFDRRIKPARPAQPPQALPPKPIQLRSRPAFTLADFTAKPPPRSVALTIDDGPSRAWTPRVLDLLRTYGVHATFCLVGQNVQRFPDLVRRIVGDGHAICNHTWDHKFGLNTASRASVEQEISMTSQAIEEVTGMAPRVFRAPFGAWSPTMFSVVAEHNMVPIDWSVDPMDWRRPGAGTIARRMLRVHAGQIVLCHDGGGNRSQTVTALETVLPRLKQRGLRFVTL